MDNTLVASAENQLLTLLYFDGIILAFPQNQILSIENLEQIQIDSSQAKINSTGTLIFGESDLPVYTLDKNLNLEQHITENNSLCIVINHPAKKESFALTCDSVKQNVNKENSVINPIPPLMYNPDSPLSGLLNMDDSLVLICSEEKMYNYINEQEHDYV